MNNRIDLTKSNIFRALIKLSIPIMATSFFQMAYNLIDMMWIGKIGSKAVAAVGAAGFYTWLGSALVLISKVGSEVGVSQSVGKNDEKLTKKYISVSIQLIVVFGLIYGLFLFLFKKPLIGFFKFNDLKVENMGVSYLTIVSYGICFFFLNPVFTAIFNGYGNSKTPFFLNGIGLIANIILDPILIFGIGPFPELGVKGAAIATITAQFIVTMAFVLYAIRKTNIFSNINLLSRPSKNITIHVLKMGTPVALHSGCFTIFSLILAKMAAKWGPTPIAVQEIGSQLEAISWMTAGGFATAISAFIGQNYGAGKYHRIYKGYFTCLLIVCTIGTVATVLFLLAGKPIFMMFIKEKEALRLGVIYLRIIGFCQILLCVEIATSGAFNGLGKTIPPSIVSIFFTGLRIPIALILSQENLLGLYGIWWSISISNILKGIILTILYALYLNKNIRNKEKQQMIIGMK